MINTQQIYRNLFLALSLIALFAAAQLSLSAHAEENNDKAAESKMNIDSAAKEAKKDKAAQAASGEENPDDLITNAKLRAESGSTSKYSINVSMDYNGGSLQKPLGENRPNITEGAELTGYSGLEGNINGKVNLTKTDSLFAGIGVRAVTPFASNVPEGAGDRFNASNPSVTYQKIGRIGGMQSIFSAGPTAFTAKDLRKVGYVANIGVQEALAYDFGGSRFTLGGYISVAGRNFDKSASSVCATTEEGDPIACGNFQPDYTAGLYPFMEYQISDNLSLRTVAGVAVFDHMRSEDRALTFVQNKMYQSIGLGYSVTRDIYLYPNIQFIPEDIRNERTNVALSTIFNLF